MTFFRSFVLLFLFSTGLTAQKITETNTDILYQKALSEYKKGDFQTSLEFTNRGLELAPEYHDIRILRVRDLWALENFSAADEDIAYLLEKAPNYIDLKPLLEQRISKFKIPAKAIIFLDKLLSIYPADLSFQVRKAQLLLQNKQRQDARELARELISKEGITGAERYVLQSILNRTVTDEIGVSYQFINFSDDYARKDPWHIGSVEYQHNFNRTAVIGRINYSDRSYDQGSLYELEAYPVINDRLYGFLNFGFSDGTLYPQLRSSASVFYNFAKIFEAELGGRLLSFNDSSYFSGILGLTVYSGKFYLNARTFLGPKRMEQLVQNYQFNLRYYLSTADNYLFLRLGSGISPDETAIYSQVQDNPNLDAWYGNLGINQSLGIHHIFQIGGGFLYEDITSNKKGSQFIGMASYRYRF